MQHFTVECVGPGGVGKTTLVNRFFQGTTTAPWQPVAALSGTVHILGDLPAFAEWEKRLLEMRLYRLTTERMSALDFYALADVAYRHAILNVTIRGSQSHDHLLADEHLMMMMSVELRDWLASGDSQISNYLTNRAFVFLEDSPDAITDRVIRRREAGIAKPQVANLGQKEIHARTKAALALYDVNRSLLIKHKVPVLRLDMGHDESVLDAKLKTFLQGLLANPTDIHNQNRHA